MLHVSKLKLLVADLDAIAGASPAGGVSLVAHLQGKCWSIFHGCPAAPLLRLSGRQPIHQHEQAAATNLTISGPEARYSPPAGGGYGEMLANFMWHAGFPHALRGPNHKAEGLDAISECIRRLSWGAPCGEMLLIVPDASFALLGCIPGTLRAFEPANCRSSDSELSEGAFPTGPKPFNPEG